MKKGISLFCTVFVLLSSGYAQSEVGVYVHPQSNFIGKNKLSTIDPNISSSVKGKGFTIGSGVFYENCQLEAISFTLGLGYMHHKNTVTYGDTLVAGAGGTTTLGFVSIPFAATYNFYASESIKLGIQLNIGINYLIAGKQNDVSMDLSPLKFNEKFYLMPGLGIHFTYLFTDNIGMSAIPTASLLTAFDPTSTKYWAFGGQIRLFYAFGY